MTLANRTAETLASWVMRRTSSIPRSATWFVTVERRGASPLATQLLVRATSREAAGQLASHLAERSRGGFFEPTRIRRSRRAHRAFDDIEL